MFCCASRYPEDKKELYALLKEQLAALCQGGERPVSKLANAAALLGAALADINWAGFYIAGEGELYLGPFQGKPACVSIPWGRGVCGTAAERDGPQMVPDVRGFPGHIACDADSNSEIVIPIHSGGRVAAVLDIDSPLKARFGEEDLKGLSELCALLEELVCWEKI